MSDSDEKYVIVRCEKVKDEHGTYKYHCKYDGGEFDVDVEDRSEEVAFMLPKKFASDDKTIREMVKLMLEPAFED